MKKLENIILTIIILFILFSSTFFVSLNISSSANETNQTNKTNITKNITAPSPQAVGLFPSVSIQVTPQSLNLGSLVSDGVENSYLSCTKVKLSASQWFSDGTLTLYVKANGDLLSDSNSINLNNLKYDGFSNSNLNKNVFTTSYSSVKSWDMTGSIYFSVSDNINGNYYLTIPTGTTPGTYSNNIYYMAMIS